MAVPEPRWTRLCPLRRVSPGTLRPLAVEGHKLVLARIDEATVAVLDNRCPHEGYPLSQGQLDGGVLTCRWHNWKFAVADGSCRLGGEDARIWPVRIVGDSVEADLAEPDPATLLPGLLASLQTGLFDRDLGRAVRDGVRLLQLGFSPRQLLAELAAWDASHAEYGCSHVLALAADCARGLGDDDGPGAMYAVAPVIDLCAETDGRLPARERAAPRATDPTVADDGDLAARMGAELRAAVQAEDVQRAQSLLAGALDAGARWSTVERWLLTIAADHFTDFGHQLIYLTKTAGLLAGLDDERTLARCTRELALGQLDGLLYATREDTLPYMARYAERLAASAERLPGWFEACREGSAFDGAPLRRAVLDGSAAEALEALEQALDAGAALGLVARELVAAGARRLLRFDVAIDADPGCLEGWLWATHRFTFAAAARQAVQTLQNPDALRFLYQALAFVHGGRALDLEPVARVEVPVGPLSPLGDTERESALEELLAALGEQRVEPAVSLAARLLASEAGATSLRRALQRLCLADPLVRPVSVTHAIKTTWAAFEERAALAEHVDRDVPVLAAVRLLASPLVERRVHELVTRSIDWVVHGKVPRKLTQ